MLLTWQKQIVAVTSMCVALMIAIGCGGTKSGDGIAPNATVVETNGYVEISRRNSNAGGRTLVNAGNVPVSVTNPPGGLTRVSISVSVKVTSYSASGTEPHARIRGLFYNDGTPGGAQGSAFADIVGGLMITNSRVYYEIARCDDGCINDTKLLTGDIGTVNLDEKHKLQVTWDNTVKKFLFQLDSNTAVEVDPTGVAPVTTFPGKRPTAGFGIRIDASAGQSGAMTAQFDDFTFNETILYDDFTGSALDPAKWSIVTIN